MVASSVTAPVAVAVFAIVFFFYSSTVFPNISSGDSGELAAAACSGSTMHPPGYPLFALTSQLSMWLVGIFLPSSTPAYRINIMSCAFGSACASTVFLASMYFSRQLSNPTPSGKPESDDKSASASTSRAGPSVLSPAFTTFVRLTVSVVAALSLALSKQIWIYSLQSEVFALNNFLCSCILYCALVALSTKNVTAMKWGAFLTGLGVCHQHTSIFISIPSVLAIFASAPGVVWSNRNSLMFCGVLGLVPYLYLPIQYKFLSFGPYVNWGDVMSFGGFFHHFVRADYGTFQLASTQLTVKIAFLYRVSVFLGVSLHELQAICLAGFVGALYSIALNVYILVSSRKAKAGSTSKTGPAPAHDASTCRTLLLFLTCTWVSYTLVFCYLSNMDLKGLLWGVHARFTMQTNVVIALGGAAFTQLLLLRDAPQQHALLVSLAVVAVLVASLCISIRSTYPEVDFSNDTFLYSFGKNVLQQLQPGSMLLSAGDVHCNIIDYLQQCEHFRLDVTVLCLPRMAYHWFPKIVSDLEPRERENRKLLGLPSNPSILWPNGTLGMRDVMGVTYSAEQFFHKNMNRFSAIYGYGAAQEVFGNLKAFVGRSRGVITKYIRTVKGKEKGVLVDPTYLDLANYTKENIDGFSSFAPLPAYAAMMQKPQYSSDTWEVHWITTFEASVFQFFGDLLKLSTLWMPEHNENVWLQPAIQFMEEFIQSFGPDMAEKRPGQKLCYMGFMRFIAAFYKADSDQDAMTRLNSLGQARSSLLKCVALQKESKYDDPMTATYEGTCLPWLQSALQEFSNSERSELARAAQQFLAQTGEASTLK